MAIAEITRRHVTELALALWRRDTSPVLLHHGVSASFADIDFRMQAYADGASLDPSEVFRHLSEHMNPAAHDFVADVAAGLLVMRLQGGIKSESQAWLQRIPHQQIVTSAYHQLMRWLGCQPDDGSGNWVTSLCRAQVDDLEVGDPDRVRRAMQSHRPDELRFIDAWGHVQGQYAQELATHSALPDTFTNSDLCTYMLARPQQASACLQQALVRGNDPAAVFLAAGISGETKLLPDLLRSASQSEITFLALDAFRRITGFDALAEQRLTWTHQRHSINKPDLATAYEAAQAWFDVHGKALPETNCFLGKPCTDVQHLVQVLRYGRQADREIAAMRTLGNGVFPVRSKVSIQQMVLDHFFPETEELV